MYQGFTHVSLHEPVLYYTCLNYYRMFVFSLLSRPLPPTRPLNTEGWSGPVCQFYVCLYVCYHYVPYPHDALYPHPPTESGNLRTHHRKKCPCVMIPLLVKQHVPNYNHRTIISLVELKTTEPVQLHAASTVWTWMSIYSWNRIRSLWLTIYWTAHHLDGTF